MELGINKSCYSLLSKVLWLIASGMVVTLVSLPYRNRGKILCAESLKILLASAVFPMPPESGSTLRRTEKFFCIGLVSWNIITPSNYLQTCFYQHLERGHLMIPSSPGSLPFAMIVQDLQVYQVPALCLKQINCFILWQDSVLSGSCRKRIHF